MLAALTLAAALQTKEELTAEIVAAQRATMERGSFAMHRVTNQRISGTNLREESDGTWQQPDLTRIRVRDFMGEVQLGTEEELIMSGTHRWQKMDQGWQEVPSLASPLVEEATNHPFRLLERMLGCADLVGMEEAHEVDGVRCKRYRVALRGPTLNALDQEMGARASNALDPAVSACVVGVFVGEEDHVVRKIETQMRMRVERNGIEAITAQTITLSRFGEVRVEVPEELRDEIGPGPE